MTHDAGFDPFSIDTLHAADCPRAWYTQSTRDTPCTCTPAESGGPLMRPRVSPTCPVCGHNDASKHTLELQRLTGVQFYEDGTPRVDLIEEQCDACFAIYKNPVFTDHGCATLFAKAGRSYGSEHPDQRVAEQIAWCEAHRLGGHDVLDYGCGSGRFLKAWPDGQRWGIEVDEPARFAAQAQGIACDPWLPFEAPFAPQVITLWHVLEHVPQPRTLLSLLRGSRGGGRPLPFDEHRRLVVEVPILEQGFTDDLCGFFSNQHTTHFSRQSLTNVLEVSGWTPITSTSLPYNGLRVVCRPCRPVSQVAGNPRDVITAQRYLQHHAKAVAAVDARLRAGTQGKPFVLWGAGMHTEMLFQETNLREHMPEWIVDGDPLKVGTAWRGVPVYGVQSISAALNVQHTDWGWPLVISSYGSQREIKAEALKMGVPESAIVTLYEDPNVY